MPGLQSIRRFQTGGAAYSPEQIRSYIDTQLAGASDAAIRAEMDRFGVTPSQVATAYNAPVADVQARYDAVGKPVAVTPPVTSPPRTLSGQLVDAYNIGNVDEINRLIKENNLTADSVQKMFPDLNIDHLLNGINLPKAPVVPLKPGEVASKTPGLTLRNDPLPVRTEQTTAFPVAPTQGRALRGSMGVSELVAQPAMRPQLNAGIRALDLGTQQFGGLTRLEQGAQQAALQMPSTAIAPSGQMEDPRQQISREGLSALINPQFTRLPTPTLTDQGRNFQAQSVQDQFAGIKATLDQNPNMTPTQMVNLMSDFGVTPDMIRRSSSPVVPPAPATPTAPAETSFGVTGDTTGRAGGLVSFQEGGMSKYTPGEVGSTFDMSEYINPDTGKFYVNEFQRDVVFNPELREAERIERLKNEEFNKESLFKKALRTGAMTYSEGGMPQLNFKKGGLASLSLFKMAEKVREAGREGDTMLAHITPEEAGILKLLGGSGTINPETGLQEFRNPFKKIIPKPIYKLGSFIGKGIESGVEKIAKDPILGPIAKAASFLHPVSAFLYAGLAPEGSSFNTKGAVTAAALQQVGEAAMDYAGGTPSTGAPGSGTGAEYGGVDGAMDLKMPNTGTTPYGPPPISDPAISPEPTVKPGDAGSNAGGADVGQGGPGMGRPGDSPTSLPPKTIGERATEFGNEIREGVSNFPKNALRFASELPGDALDYAKNNKVNTAFLGTQIYAGIQGAKERKKFEEEQVRLALEEEEKRRRFSDLFGRTLGTVNAASGGLMALAKGGAPMMEAGGTTGPTGEPRMVKGTGDGMSDNVPATIEGVQEARLANDEFVVPADVVADIGNGSSSAGAKKLYDMMDRVRKARHKTTKQPPEINAERLMPA